MVVDTKQALAEAWTGKVEETAYTFGERRVFARLAWDHEPPQAVYVRVEYLEDPYVPETMKREWAGDSLGPDSGMTPEVWLERQVLACLAALEAGTARPHQGDALSDSWFKGMLG